MNMAFLVDFKCDVDQSQAQGQPTWGQNEAVRPSWVKACLETTQTLAVGPDLNLAIQPS